MASNPNAKLRTLTTSKGTITGAKGLMDHLFGAQDTEWGTTGIFGNRKRPYRSRQRSNARAGEVMFMELTSGDVYSVRSTMAQKDFISEVIRQAGGKVEEVWSERGTQYGKKVKTLNPLD